MRKIVKQRHWSQSNVFPVFQINFPAQNQDFVVLEGHSNDTLLFGPGRSSDSYLPGDCSTVVIHANHHFTFLQNINLNDQVILSDQMGMEYQYCVLDVSIMDIDQEQIKVSNIDELKLVTPWPFDGFTKDNTLRYIVTARKYETYQN
ncbi:sortase [Candidatus Thioglobus sp.]|jgi:LPXTG-site transpeptidase (sortase) family protein|uniref:sortase domain-containing protein n=1 Tax=Candidatus Thioglobus sp. TaxID=2026721 RepID=UPI001D430B11|nr:sortase [Candidatus Thioglobus sp.]MBT3276940.1 sortase [Candidatus Thioglobus sp.]MBT3446930.1 sortase [Candidatus Thioglobus sp.]MBT3744466.1 sortase [Candidatus Thioglobus sp.]MBT4001276.1 sortase [Candidatus Thioglobus sp.]MBT4181406.1 sortase [Candidatus Thioglobus sp.]